MHSTLAADPMIAAMVRARAALPDQYEETVHVSGSDGAFDAKAFVGGADYRITVVLDGQTYGFGRVLGRSWRQTPNGLVRIIRSDVQGDPLDRWPRSQFGFASNGCESAGTTQSGGESLWMLHCGPAGDIQHWYAIDPDSGRIVRETTREGAKITTYDFTDDRHWTIHGFGGDAAVTVTNRTVEDVSQDDVAIPPITREIFELPQSGVANVPATFKFHINAPVEIDGVRRDFVVDTGTTQVLLDVGEAARLGLHPRFGHVVIPELRVGDAVAHNVAAQAVDLFNDRDGAGILGYEFFSGHVVHIDYRAQIVELISHDRFQSPKGARPMAIDPREGMPLIEAGANGVQRPRFAIDTGSYWILLSADFAARVGAQDYPTMREAGNVDFLEGPMYTVLRQMPSFDIGPYHIEEPVAAVEQAEPQNLDIPLDGIVGQDVLASFEWWYDYDDGVVWIRSKS